MEYWIECISEAFDDQNIVATKEQIEAVASWVEGAHDNYGMATGIHFCDRPSESEAKRELRELKEEQDRQRVWEVTTKPCKCCYTAGVVSDNWGRMVVCDYCGGKGRV